MKGRAASLKLRKKSGPKNLAAVLHKCFKCYKLHSVTSYLIIYIFYFNVFLKEFRERHFYITWNLINGCNITETIRKDLSVKARTYFSFYCFHLIFKADRGREMWKFIYEHDNKNRPHSVNTSYLKFILIFQDITQKKIRRCYKFERGKVVEKYLASVWYILLKLDVEAPKVFFEF